MKIYEKADSEMLEYLQQALAMDENKDISVFNIRYGVMTVSALDRDETQFRAFKTLPYKVHICSASDVLIKEYDVEIIIDSLYWNSLTEDSEKIALFFSATNQLFVKTDKDGIPKYDDNGHYKIGKKSPGLVIECFENPSSIFGLDSPDIKMLVTAKSDYDDIFKYVC